MALHTDGDWEFDVNREVVSTDAEFFFRLSSLLLIAGWTVIERSDGTTVSVGVQNSAGEWDNSNA